MSLYYNDTIIGASNHVYFNGSDVKKIYIKDPKIDEEYHLVYEYDITPPNLVMTYPPAQSISCSTSTYYLKGRAYDTQTSVASIKVNNNAIAFDANGNFNYTISLAGGVNTISIEVADTNGNYKYYYYYITYTNDKNTATSNWTDAGQEAIYEGYYDRVWSNGTIYRRLMKQSSPTRTGQWCDNSFSFSTSLYLPKGLKNFNLQWGAYASLGDKSGQWNSSSSSLEIWDDTTGSRLYANSISARSSGANPGSAPSTSGTHMTNVQMSLSEEQSTHVLRIVYSGSVRASGRDWSTGRLGIHSWTFNYY